MVKRPLEGLGYESKKVPQEGLSEKEFLSIKEFTELVGMAYSTYRKLRAEGKAPREIRLSRRTIRIRTEDVDAWAQANAPGLPVLLHSAAQQVQRPSRALAPSGNDLHVLVPLPEFLALAGLTPEEYVRRRAAGRTPPEVVRKWEERLVDVQDASLAR